jgi:hypothetical protein
MANVACPSPTLFTICARSCTSVSVQSRDDRSRNVVGQLLSCSCSLDATNTVPESVPLAH